MATSIGWNQIEIKRKTPRLGTNGSLPLLSGLDPRLFSAAILCPVHQSDKIVVDSTHYGQRPFAHGAINERLGVLLLSQAGFLYLFPLRPASQSSSSILSNASISRLPAWISCMTRARVRRNPVGG